MSRTPNADDGAGHCTATHTGQDRDDQMPPSNTERADLIARVEAADLAELRRVAEAATPGPWVLIIGGIHGDSYLVCEDVPGFLKPVCVTEHDGPKSEEDAAFIAKANPAAILHLLDVLATQREALEEIAANEVEVFDEDLNVTVIVSYHEDELSEIALKALEASHP